MHIFGICSYNACLRWQCNYQYTQFQRWNYSIISTQYFRYIDISAILFILCMLYKRVTTFGPFLKHKSIRIILLHKVCLVRSPQYMFNIFLFFESHILLHLYPIYKLFNKIKNSNKSADAKSILCWIFLLFFIITDFVKPLFYINISCCNSLTT